MNAAGRQEFLHVELSDIKPEGAKKGEIVMTKIVITDDSEFENLLSTIMAMTRDNLSKLSLYQSKWGGQFSNAITVTLSPTDNLGKTGCTQNFFGGNFTYEFLLLKFIAQT